MQTQSITTQAQDELAQVRLPRVVQATYLAPLKRQPQRKNPTPTCDLQLRSYSVRNLEIFADFALRAAYYLNLPASGPVPLPKITERWTVPKSNFIFKKSQENFERITLRRLIQIKDGNPETVSIWLGFLKKHQYYGVGMKANVWEHTGLDVPQDMDAEAKRILDKLGAAEDQPDTQREAPGTTEAKRQRLEVEPFKAQWGAFAPMGGAATVASASKRLETVVVRTHTLIENVVDSGYLPHFVLRRGIRAQLRQRIQLIASTSLTDAYETKMKYVNLLMTRPIAIETAKANTQHYEVGTSVLQAMLGRRMKYSACLYPKHTETLAQAEMAMLELYVERAGLKDGMRMFDLGCGWGSLSLYLAEMFPNSQVTAFSNSKTQKRHIDSQARQRGFKNLEVITGDIATYTFTGTDLEEAFDRVLSIEMFEHMKNYDALMQKCSTLLKSNGSSKLFVHIFAHRSTPYDFESGWMTDHFFTGGTMPSADLLLFFQRDLKIEQQWWVNGQHYAKTCEDWLSNMIRQKADLWPGLVETYGSQAEAYRWYNRWQVFYLACAELFAYDGGDTWGVTHFLFVKPRKSTQS